MTRHTWLALSIVALALPWMPGMPQFWVSLACQIGIAAIIATGLVVLTGVAGMTSFAQSGLMGVGAYATAVISASYGMSPWLGLPVALLASLVVALGMGAITLRLSGHYLALGTIAWSGDLPVAGTDAFVAKFLKAFPDQKFAPQEAGEGYAIGQLIGAAIVNAGSADPAKVRDALAAIKVQTILPGGPVEFDDAGLSRHTVPIMVQWQKGKLRTIWPKEYQTTPPIVG